MTVSNSHIWGPHCAVLCELPQGTIVEHMGADRAVSAAYPEGSLLVKTNNGYYCVSIADGRYEKLYVAKVPDVH